MGFRTTRLGISLVACLLPATLIGLAGQAEAAPIVSDSYLIGSGGYTAGLKLLSQPSVAAPGFAAGSTYNSGSQTSNFIVYAGGLAPTDPANAGQVGYDGVSDNTIRSNARNFAPVTSVGTYWFSIQVSQDGTSSPLAASPIGYALAGFGNTTPPVLGATTTTGTTAGTSAYLQGLFFGFAHESGDPSTANADLVIRYRDTIGYTAGDSVLVTNALANKTYSIIARLDVNTTGPNNAIDNLTYWVNPTDTSSQSALDHSSLVNNDGNPVGTYAFQTSADFTRLTYSAQAWNGDIHSANFGDPRLGTTLADVIPAGTAVPEPTSIVLLGLGLVGGLGLAIRRRRALT